jgi:hypothetical protein
MQNNNSGGGIAILVISLVIVAVAVLNRLFDVVGKYARSDLMRRHKLYLRLFRIPLALSLIAIASWFIVPYSVTTYRGGLIASVLGVGISIFAAESFKKLTEFRRVKRTFGMLKYVAVPYLHSHAQDITDTLKNYKGTLSTLQAFLLLGLVANFDTISLAFDKSWLQLVHSQDFIDALDNDDQFYKIADVEFEVASFTKNLAGQSIRAKYLLANGQQLIAGNMQSQFLSQVQGIRDSLKESGKSLEQYSKDLEKEIDDFLLQNGVSYQRS